MWRGAMVGMKQACSRLKLLVLHTKKTPNWGVTPQVLTRMVPENPIVVPAVKIKIDDFES